MRAFQLILGSQSPRRKELLSLLEIPFEVRIRPTDELLPEGLIGEASALFLAAQKAAPFEIDLQDDEIILTADTEVWLQNRRLGKPKNNQEATAMLRALSGQTHEVISGVCLLTKQEKISFAVTTKVTFGKLTPNQIAHYVDTYQPFDKAGGYGIQEWIGWVGIEKIEGSYANVVGLPVREVSAQLSKYTFK
ncbi:MAG: Maf family nucleotide pyrophosphatase [Schleiferiaceae bacterium]|nr:Maf family nucleotide pyrophosphatase [Schleiferiaceae bacterium]